jgi:PKD repeat protein
VPHSGGTGNQLPTAYFEDSVDRDNGLQVHFTDQSSDPGGTIEEWTWDFGDGSSGSTAEDPDYTFASSGTSNVSLTVTDNNGATDVTAQQVTVNGANVGPTAAFTFTVNGPAVSFTDLSSDPDDGITAWSWDFGDTIRSSAQNPFHTYAAGSYTVILTATDGGGASDTTSMQVSVTGTNQAPTADFS